MATSAAVAASSAPSAARASQLSSTASASAARSPAPNAPAAAWAAFDEARHAGGDLRVSRRGAFAQRGVEPSRRGRARRVPGDHELEVRSDGDRRDRRQQPALDLVEPVGLDEHRRVVGLHRSIHPPRCDTELDVLGLEGQRCDERRRDGHAPAVRKGSDGGDRQRGRPGEPHGPRDLRAPDDLERRVIERCTGLAEPCDEPHERSGHDSFSALVSVPAHRRHQRRHAAMRLGRRCGADRHGIAGAHLDPCPELGHRDRERRAAERIGRVAGDAGTGRALADADLIRPLRRHRSSVARCVTALRAQRCELSAALPRGCGACGRTCPHRCGRPPARATSRPWRSRRRW